MRRAHSPLAWPGGKAYLAKRLVALLPPHTHYCEPFAGGLNVLLAHDGEGRSECVNDLDGQVANFWAVLRDRELFPRFVRMAEATAFGDPSFAEASAVFTEGCLVRRAWAFFVRCRQSIGARQLRLAPLSIGKTNRGMNRQASAWLSAVDMLPAVHERLRRVVVLNRPALDVIRAQDGPGTVFYLDPPYVPSTRADQESGYDREMTEADHGELLDLLATVRGRVLLSGYRSALYDRALRRWHRLDFATPIRARCTASQRRAVESVWLNYVPEEGRLAA